MKRLYICSIGMELDDISVRTLRIIRSVDVVANLILGVNELVRFGVKKFVMLNEVIEKHKIKPYVKVGKKSDPKARLIISEIEKIFKRYDTVALLTNTNPLFLYRFNFDVFKYFSKKIRVEVYPSISSIDYFTHYVIVNFCYYLEDFIIFSFPCSIKSLIKEDLRDINIFIMYPYFFDKVTIKKLLSVYDEKDIFFTIKCSFYNNHDFFIKKYCFSFLEKVVNDIDPFTTLFIPSKDFVDKLDKRIKK